MKNISWVNLFCGVGLFISIALGTLHFFKADITYDTDIARDFLLLQEMVQQRKVSLIGGRSSISGVFHGPLYYWMALPFFAVSKGNPIAVSFLWLLLYWLFLGSFYFVGKKTFGNQFAIISTTLIASLTTFIPEGFTHTVIANFLIIPLIYIASLYLKEQKVKYLSLVVLMIGLLIQFQMAFGVPVLILLGGYILYHILKQKKYLHLLAGILIVLPLSTFLLFDLRHEFIQMKSVITYLGNDNTSNSLTEYFRNRVVSILDSFSIMNFPHAEVRNIQSIGVLLSLLFLMGKAIKSNQKNKSFIMVALLIIFGFWIITIPFKGNVWSQYYRPLLPIIVFCVSYLLLKLIPKKFGVALLMMIIGCNLFFQINAGIKYMRSTPIADEVHWKFYRQMANDIFVDNNRQAFGYFTFSPDQFAYQAKYALRYFAEENHIPTAPFKKLPVTYLIIAPNDHLNPWANEEYWQINQVKINKEPSKMWTYSTAVSYNYSVRKFLLNEEDLEIDADPNLLDGIHFR